MHYNEILRKLNSLSNPDAVEGMVKCGITPENTYGVSIPELRKIASVTKRNHELAKQLWKKNTRETRILASMIDEPNKVDEKQMEKWVREFSYWEICDQVIMNLFEKTKFAYEKAFEWAERKEEFVKRAGYVLMARLVVSDKKAEDRIFEKFFPMIKQGSDDSRNFVKKAVNWALRQIGKRNKNLNKKAIEVAIEIEQMTSSSAKWIASDALRELKSSEVQNRLN
ncbi:MAG: DNA alkylation repair protein [Candidatus Nanoarchaeia archaeon]|nr:DNA alkylation repair protein [Candidatus Nanoarchaeia archaeon]